MVIKTLETGHYEGLGTVRFDRSRRARRLNISIRPDREIRVAVPQGVSLKTAKVFLEKNRDWVIKSLAKIQRVENAGTEVDYSHFRTREHQLILEPRPSPDLLINITRGLIRVQYPSNLAETEDSVQWAIKKGIIEAFRIEAKKHLLPRVALLADRFGFECNKVFVKNMKSRWGSCSAKNNINLNLQLMRFSDELVDYVILHELAHTRIKNHGKLFWQQVAAICPNHMEHRRQLRRFKPIIL
jgi:hypothetical protein